MADINLPSISDTITTSENLVAGSAPPASANRKILGNSFGGSVVDGNRVALVGVGNFIQTKDSSASPQNSPLTVSNSVLSLTVPLNATSVQLYSTSNDIRVSEHPTLASYFVLKASTLVTLDCARQAIFYLLRDGGSDATLQFAFKVV